MGSRGGLGRRHGGFSLLELVIAIGVLGLILSSVALLQLRANDASKSMQARDDAETRARRVLDRIAEELTGVGRTLMFPDPNTSAGTSTITFQRSIGVSEEPGNEGVVLYMPTAPPGISVAQAAATLQVMDR